jgi:DNA mismatch endonuclease (patch repair protein)
MTDKVDTTTRSRMMSTIKGKNTAPEIFVRCALHAKGFRYRLGGCNLPGRPDLVFPSRKVVLFVHGCFWHRHYCTYFKWPASNVEFWRSKLTRNAERDERNYRVLEGLGWMVLVIWECEIRRSGYKLPNASIEHLETLLRQAHQR